MNQKQQIGLLGGLVVVGAVVFYFDLGGQGITGGSRLNTLKPPTAFTIENPSLRRDKLRATQQTEYKSSGRDIFSEVVHVDRPKPVPQKDPGPQLPPPPPPPPPLTLPVKFYGYGSVPTKRAFLTDGDKIFIVGEGDTLLGRFRILRISNASLEFEDTADGRRGTAPLEEQAAPQ
jgi:hypothetical protein